jgi:hypothetical protein
MGSLNLFPYWNIKSGEINFKKVEFRKQNIEVRSLTIEKK